MSGKRSYVLLGLSLVACVDTNSSSPPAGSEVGENRPAPELGAQSPTGSAAAGAGSVSETPSTPSELGVPGGALATPGAPSAPAAPGAAGAAQTGSGEPPCALPTSFRWASGNPVIQPVSDPSHDLVAIKDPSIVFFNDRWHVYASSVSAAGAYGLVYLSFTDFSEASSAPLYYMDQTPGFATYVAAPQLFFFAPQNRWYLVFQSGPPMFSTTDDPGKPETWTRPAPFFAAEPSIITQNGGWLDFWVICDESRCHLFFSDDHGRFYRSDTTLEDFPRGFSEPSIVLQDPDAGRLFEASNVYRLRGAEPRYLALIEAFDSTSNWRRYFRSFTADSLDGAWTPLQDSGSTPFAGPSNVSFPAPAWANDISHGELIRAGYDQTLTLDACDLRFLYQAYDSTFQTDNYNAIPWQLGLLTRVP